MICPSCTTGLNTVVRNGVEIDVCPRCRGVWLDRGELEKLMSQVPDEDDGEDEYDNESEDRGGRYGEHRGRPPRKKGFWGSLFDFE